MKKLLLSLVIAFTCFLLSNNALATVLKSQTDHSVRITTRPYKRVFGTGTGMVSGVSSPYSVKFWVDNSTGSDIVINSQTYGRGIFESDNYAYAKYFNWYPITVPANTNDFEIVYNGFTNTGSWMSSAVSWHLYPFQGNNPPTGLYTKGSSNADTGFAYILDSGSQSSASTPLLTVTRNPEAGGGVASSDDEIQCGVNQLNYCQATFLLNSEVELEAFPNTGYAFTYWDDGTNQYTDNPHTFTMDGAKEVTAAFSPPVRCATGDFRFNIDDTGGECVAYVRDETDIEIYGNAYTWYQTAIDDGYWVGSTPEVSAIIVFASQDGMSNGHVGIVKEKLDATHLRLRDSNWGLDGLVDEHTIDLSNFTILGYIYCTP